MNSTKIAFIGTGLMGLPMARNLLRAGYPLTAYNRTRSKAEPLQKDGAKLASSPSEAAKDAQIIISIVSDTPDVEQVLTGENGVIRTAKPGSIVIDMSTISPSATRIIAQNLEARGVEMLDAPVSGGDTGAIAGTLSIMVGGKKEILDQSMPILKTMGKTITYCGGHGMGQMTKLCNQVAISLHMLAASEAIAFAEKAGLDPSLMVQAVGSGAAGSWVINNLGTKMVKHDFAPGFMVRLLQKDLRICLATASEIGASLPGASLAHQLYNSIEAHGRGDEGTQSLIALLEEMANIEIEKRTE